MTEANDKSLRYPILEEYPAVYRDEHGEERTVITNDGMHLRMTVCGVTFVGKTPDDFEPEAVTDSGVLTSFTLNPIPYLGRHDHRHELCNCEIEYRAPMPMVDHGQPAEATLRVLLRLGQPTDRGWLSEENLRLALFYKEQTYQGDGTSGWFEDELLEIQTALPDGVFLKACITCAFSDYSPYGHGLFGGMACFRNEKASYRAVRSKYDLFAIWDSHTEQVQETYCCPEFERRQPGTGYRG